MRAEWEPDELIEAWTLVKSDWDLIANKAGVTRLGFAVMLKFYEIEGRFPAYREEVPQAAVDYLGSLVKVESALFAKYSWRGRTTFPAVLVARQPLRAVPPRHGCPPRPRRRLTHAALHRALTGPDGQGRLPRVQLRSYFSG